MPDTSTARDAISTARQYHRDVTVGLSMAELKLRAAAGLERPDPLLGDPPLLLLEDSPVWVEHALSGLGMAIEACDALRAALVVAKDETAKLETRDG